jgi:ribonuclease P protein component
MKGLAKLETNLSTEPPAAGEDPRLPHSNAHSGWPQRDQAAAPKGAASPDSMKGGGRGCSFPKSLRLLKRPEFRLAYEKGRRQNARICTVFTRSNGLPQTRLGITTPSALGGAVVRNHIRRRLREVFRLNRSQIPGGWDVVLNPRLSVATLPFEKLTREVLKLFPAASPSAAIGQGQSSSSRC